MHFPVKRFSITLSHFQNYILVLSLLLSSSNISESIIFEDILVFSLFYDIQKM
jgi:hypothetical protein